MEWTSRTTPKKKDIWCDMSANKADEIFSTYIKKLSIDDWKCCRHDLYIFTQNHLFLLRLGKRKQLVQINPDSNSFDYLWCT